MVNILGSQDSVVFSGFVVLDKGEEVTYSFGYFHFIIFCIIPEAPCKGSLCSKGRICPLCSCKDSVFGGIFGDAGIVACEGQLHARH